MAVEDIGLADPQALVICNAAKDAYEYLGSPEGELALAQACVYLATAPKSNAAYMAFGAAMVRAAVEPAVNFAVTHFRFLQGQGPIVRNQGSAWPTLKD